MVHLSQIRLLIAVCSFTITGLTAQTNAPTTCTSAMDLTFVVDSSGSICNDKPVTTCHNWEALLRFMRRIVTDMDIGENDVRVALIEFESSAWIKWNLTAYTSKSLLLEKIDNLPYTGGNTNTIAALDSLSYIFNKTNGDRPDVRKTAIIITDGKPRRGSDPIPIDEIRTAVRRVTVDWGIQLLVVGVTDNIDMDTLKELSSYPHTVNETVFVVEDYIKLNRVLTQLRRQNCINEPTKSLSHEQCQESLDLCFVIDASGSICDYDPSFHYDTEETCSNWNYIINFIRSIATHFDIGLQTTRVGLVIFSSHSYVAWNLTAYTNLSSLQRAINSLVYRKGGETDMTGGLRLMRTQIFNPSDDRPDIPNVAIILTDGFPTVASTLDPEIRTVHNSGINTLVVGITNRIDRNTIVTLASSPQKENETYFFNPDYATLDRDFKKQIRTQTCNFPTST